MQGVVTGGRLRVCNCGWEECLPGHQYGPAIRDHILIHYVAAGEGVFYADGREYRLRAGQGFVILPGEVTTYRADDLRPWTYGWVGFQGEDAGGLLRLAALSPARRVFDAPDAAELSRVLQAIYRDASTLDLGELGALGGLYRFVALIAQGRGGAEDKSSSRACFDRARWFMQGRYALPLRITEVAAFVGLSRSQLFRVFQAEAGASPKEYLQRLRLAHAEQLLLETDLTIEQTALSVGMGSAQHLSAAFKRQYGATPAVYRRQKRREST